MTTEEKSEARTEPARSAQAARLAERLALIGFLLYAVFAPHSIAGAELSLALVGAGWLMRGLLAGRWGIGRTALDLPIWLFLGWTVASSLLSTEPRISLLKLQSVCVFFLFYLARAMLTKRSAVAVAFLMLASGVAGSLWSLADIARGRGVVIASMASTSPFRGGPLGEGDAVWRLGQRRVNGLEELDDAIRRSGTGERLSVSFISRGEHGEWPGFIVTDELKARPSPSGIESAGRTHRFRASGWTRHYETFCETLQILAQLALGLFLSNLKRRAGRASAILALAAWLLLGVGIILTAMRTVMLALAFGACVVAWRGTRGRARAFVLSGMVLLLIAGALVVRETRATGALMLRDDSSSLRLRVARNGAARIMLRPLFGHGMDAVKNHWSEWGFPGSEMIHLHSTPLQLAFDRGLPALLFWLWMMWTFWRLAARAEARARDSEARAREPLEANSYGLLLGATGAIAGFFASSLVNYNFGDGEVALVFWWLMGTVVVLAGPLADKRTGKEA